MICGLYKNQTSPDFTFIKNGGQNFRLENGTWTKANFDKRKEVGKYVDRKEDIIFSNSSSCSKQNYTHDLEWHYDKIVQDGEYVYQVCLKYIPPFNSTFGDAYKVFY